MKYKGFNKKKEEVIGNLITSYDGKYYIGYLHPKTLCFDGDEVQKDSITKIENKEELIEMALQQMIGFRLGSWGAYPQELVSSMGLSKEEWEYIKKTQDKGFMDEKDVIQIDEYYKNN